MQKHFKVSILAAALLAAGCGGGGGGGTAAQPEPLAVTGTAVKGIIIGGVVEAFAITDGQVADTPLATTTTDASGNYSLELPGDFSGDIKILVRGAESGSSMKCDLAAGCDSDGDGTADAQFGESVALTPAFSLSALRPNVAGEVAVNVTALTDLATRLAEQNPNGLDVTSIEGANSQVANLFGITGDLSALPVIDLTDGESLAAVSDNSARRAALLSAGLLQAASSSGGQSMEEALTALATEFLANDGQLIVNDGGADDSVSLSDVLSAVTAIITTVESASETDLGEVATELESEAGAAEQSAEGELTNAQPSPEAGSPALTQAKAMVGDVRSLVNASGLGVLETGAKAFGDNVEMAGELLEPDLDSAVGALEQAVTAMAEALEEHMAAATTPTEAYSYQASNGVNVALTPAGDGVVLDVEETLDGNALAISATFDGTVEESSSEGENSWQDELLVDVSLSAAGSISNSGVTLTLAEGSDIALDFTATESENWANSNNEQGWSYSSDSNGELQLNAASLLLDVSIAQAASEAVTNPLLFNGALELALSGGQFSWQESEEHGCSDNDSGSVCEDHNSSTESATFDSASLKLTGELADSEDNKVALNLLINAQANGFVLEHNYSELYRNLWSNSGMSSDDYSVEDSFNDESEEAFVSFDFSLSIVAALPGVAEQTSISVSGARTGLDAGNLSGELQWLGKQLDISADAGSETIIATNQDGVVLTLHEEEGSNIIGRIRKGDELLASVERSGDNLVLVRYKDGSFESAL